MVLIAQPLLGSRTSAYLEWLANEIIMTANKTDYKDELLVMLFTNKRKQQTHIAYHTPWSRKTIPTSRVSLTSTLCT